MHTFTITVPISGRDEHYLSVRVLPELSDSLSVGKEVIDGELIQVEFNAERHDVRYSKRFNLIASKDYYAEIRFIFDEFKPVYAVVNGAKPIYE